MVSNTTGDRNVAVGWSALTTNVDGDRSVAVGYAALENQEPASNVDMYNTAVGYTAGKTLTTGTDDTIIGGLAGIAITTAAGCTLVGKEAGTAITTGGDNTGIGKGTLKAHTTGTGNTAVGKDALESNTTASNNTAVGKFAGDSITTGANNTFVGMSAGHTSVDSSSNIMVGFEAIASATGTSEMVIGISVSGKGDDTGFLAPPGGASMFQSSNATTFQQTSDRRIKKNIVDNNDGLEQIKQIRVRNFEYRTEDEITDFENTKSTVVEKEGIQLGAIAQEIEEVFPDMVTTQSTGVKTVNTDNLTWYLVNAVQELSTQVGELQSELKALKGE